MGGLRVHMLMFSEISCTILTSEDVLYIFIISKPAQNVPESLLKSPEKVEEWRRRPHIYGFPPKFKPFKLNPPYSYHGTTFQFALARFSPTPFNRNVLYVRSPHRSISFPLSPI